MKTKATLIASCVIVAAALALVPVGLIRWNSGHEKASADTSLVRQHLMQEMGIRFVPASDSESERPSLPNGRKAASRTEAIDLAMTHTVGARNGNLLPGAHMTAQFGSISDDQLSHRLPSGQLKPLFQNKPVWLVTFSGLQIPSAGPRMTFNHEESVVVDGRTGRYLESFSFR